MVTEKEMVSGTVSRRLALISRREVAGGPRGCISACQRLAMWVAFLLLLLLLPLPLSVHAEDLGKLSANLAVLSGS